MIKAQLKFIRVDQGFYRVDMEKMHNGRKVYPMYATIEQNRFGRKLWTVHIEGIGRLLDDQGYDCFTLAIAKRLIKETIK